MKSYSFYFLKNTIRFVWDVAKVNFMHCPNFITRARELRNLYIFTLPIAGVDA